MSTNLVPHLIHIRQFADPLAEPYQPENTSPEPSRNTSDWSVKLVAQAEKSWTVSGTSVLAAWILAFVGSLGIVLLYSWRRRRGDPVIYLPRYLALVQREPEVKGRREQGEWFPLIPSTADPGGQTSTAQRDRDGDGKNDIDQNTRKVGGESEGRGVLDEPFLGWIRPAWRDFWVEINVLNRKPALERDRL